LPELVCHSKDRHSSHMNGGLPGMASIQNLVNGALKNDSRARMPRAYLARQIFSNETGRKEHMIHPAELPERQVTQTATKRIANEQGAGQNGRAHGHA